MIRDTHDRTVSSLDDKRKIRGKGTSVSGSGGLIVGVGRGHVVGKLSGSLEHLTLVVGSIGVLKVLGEGLHERKWSEEQRSEVKSKGEFSLARSRIACWFGTS